MTIIATAMLLVRPRRTMTPASPAAQMRSPGFFIVLCLRSILELCCNRKRLAMYLAS
jgi:hypothetical protein